MTDDLTGLAWPLSGLGTALEALARRSELSPRSVPIPNPPRAVAQSEDGLGDWIEGAAGWLGLEAEPVACSYEGVERFARQAGPALLALPGDGRIRFLALLGTQRHRAVFLRPDLAVERVRMERLRDALCPQSELLPEIDRLLDASGVSEGRRARARVVLLQQRLRARPIRVAWLVRLSPGAPIGTQARDARLPSRLSRLALAHAAEYALWVLSWWLVGRAALEGQFDAGLLLGWGLLLVTIVPFRLLTTWLQGTIAIGVGATLKQRLLYGALRLTPEEIRHRGAGQFLAQVIESEAVESLALSGGFLGLVAAIELVAALAILGFGASGAVEMVLLLSWIALTLALTLRYFRRRERWTRERLAMTHDLVERMVGYRTRLAQEPRERWHDGEDQVLERYVESSQAMDQAAALVSAFPPRGWLVLGFAGLTPAFVAGTSTPARLAVALGGILLAYRALRRLTQGLVYLADAGICWQRVAPLFHAAARPQLVGAPEFSLAAPPHPAASDGQARLLDGRNLSFRYRDRGEPVLRGCDLAVGHGDRLLLEGPSGGGKSTLASLLVGLRLPESGLLLLHGLDHRTLGDEGWRRRVASAPQFHENHVLTETFLFNLLMSRRWPPLENDIQEATTICRELGLGELVERMPAGLNQMVGEMGWQLSHGERSRLFIARALLQGAEMIILDESFAALDPENLERALQCVLRRAPTLLVVAHP